MEDCDEFDPKSSGLCRLRPLEEAFQGHGARRFRLNASLFSLGEFLDANDGQEGLLDAEAPAFVESFDVNDGAMVLKGSPWTLEIVGTCGGAKEGNRVWGGQQQFRQHPRPSVGLMFENKHRGCEQKQEGSRSKASQDGLLSEGGHNPSTSPGT